MLLALPFLRCAGPSQNLHLATNNFVSIINGDLLCETTLPLGKYREDAIDNSIKMQLFHFEFIPIFPESIKAEFLCTSTFSVIFQSKFIFVLNDFAWEFFVRYARLLICQCLHENAFLRK